MCRGRSQPAVIHVALDEVFHTLVPKDCPAAGARTRRPMDLLGFTYFIICISLRSRPCTGDDRGDAIYLPWVVARDCTHYKSWGIGTSFPSRSGFPVVFRRQLFLARGMIHVVMMIVVRFVSVTSTPRRILHSRLLVFMHLYSSPLPCAIPW